MGENEPVGDDAAPPLIPPEVRGGLRRGAFGYAPAAVERMVEAMTARYEQLWRENSELRAQVQRLKQEVARRSGEEREIREALIAAHGAAEALRRQAVADAERKTRAAEERVRGALEEAGARQRSIEAEVEQLKSVGTEIQSGYRAFLLAALELLESQSKRLEAGPAAAAELERAGEEAPAEGAASPGSVSRGGT